MPSFALITEGITDQIVIENILYGFVGDAEIDINPLQPLRDETDENRTASPGNWHKVLEYCSSDRFKDALQFNDFIVVQIDTDVCHDYQVSDRDEEGNELSVEDMTERIQLFLIQRIGAEFYAKYRPRILFAIAVQSIECWLLPLAYTNNKKGKITGCLETLNRALSKQKSFSIDPNNKRPEYYRIVSDPYSKHKKLMSLYESNPSLNTFIRSLEESVPLAQ
jgi:hypothetical protein